MIAGVVFGHESAAALIRELGRNGELRQVCGFDPLQQEEAVPPDYVYSRFFEKLFEHADVVEEIFDRLVERVRRLLPDFGKDLAVDGKALPTHGLNDGEANWGVKSYRGVREDGTAWEAVTRWFGYKLHLIVDAQYELPVAYEVTQASVADSPRLMPMVEKLQEDHPRLLKRAKTLAGDKGYDDGADKAELYDTYGIVPLIDTRDLHHEDSGGRMRPLDPQQSDTIYFSGTGEVCCKVEPFAKEEAGQFARMQFIGIRDGAKDAEVPLSGGGLRDRVQQPPGLPVPADGARRPVWARGARTAGAKPAAVSSDPPAQLHVPAPVQKAHGGRAGQQPHRPCLRLRAPLHPRPEENAMPRGPGPDRHAGHGRLVDRGRPGRAGALAAAGRVAPRWAAPPEPNRKETGHLG